MREAYFSEKGDKGSRCFNRRNVMQKTHDKKNCQSKTLIKKNTAKMKMEQNFRNQTLIEFSIRSTGLQECFVFIQL